MLVLQSSSWSCSTSQRQCHTSAHEAMHTWLCCRLLLPAWNPGSAVTAGLVTGRAAELHTWAEGLLLTWGLALCDSHPAPWCAAALGKELLKCFREWLIPTDAGTHPSGFVVSCWFSSDLSLCFLSFCLCFSPCSALGQGASSHLPAHMQPLLLLPGRSDSVTFAAATSLAVSLHTLQSLFQLKPLPGAVKNCVWWGCGQHGKRKLHCMLSPHL